MAAQNYSLNDLVGSRPSAPATSGGLNTSELLPSYRPGLTDMRTNPGFIDMRSQSTYRPPTQSVPLPSSYPGFSALPASTPMPTSIAESWFQHFTVDNGRKSSDRFMHTMQACFAGATSAEVQELFYGCKKYSMKKTEFLDVYNGNLEASKRNMESLGISQENIENSAPRKVYRTRGVALQEILGKYFWGKVTEKNLSWGNWVRIPEVEKYINMIRDSNQVLKAPYQAAFYSHAYWMVADFDRAFDEMAKRLEMVLGLSIILGNTCKFDERGNITDLRRESFGDEMASFQNTSLNGVTLETVHALIIQKKVSTHFLLVCAVMVDPRKLLQTKTFRMKRTQKAGMKTEEELRMLKRIVGLMIQIIASAEMILGAQNLLSSVDKISLARSSAFMKVYWNSFNVVHTAIRTTKRACFGGNRGENTRGLDLEIEFSKEEFFATPKERAETLTELNSLLGKP